MDEIESIVPSFPENVIPITMWPFYFMRRIDREIQEATGITPDMLNRSSTTGVPFHEKDYGRSVCIDMFENYARNRLTKDARWRDAVRALHGKTLGCWCAPKPCHGDVLLKLAAELVSASSSTTCRDRK